MGWDHSCSGQGWCRGSSPRWDSWAPALLAATIATLFGQIEQSSAAAALAALPVAVWELSLGVYMVVKGFKPSPIIATSTPSAPVSRKVIVA